VTTRQAEPRDLGVARGYLDGQWLDRSSLGITEHVDPSTGSANGTVQLCGADEVDTAVASAKAAFPAWRAMPGDKRRRILQRVEELVEERLPELGRLTTLELGHPSLTAMSLSYLCAVWFGYYAGLADKIEGATIPMTPAFNAGFDYTLAEPYGVVGIILTWNGPMVSVGMKVAPALAAGNCVVVKTPELAPFTVARFAEIAIEAGIPPGVLHVLPGGPEAGDRLVRHPDVGKISFTGGIPTARKIMEAATDTLKPVVLELGGKSANIIFPDADLDAAVSLSVQSCFTMAGQGCVLATRMLVHEEVYDEVVGAAGRAVSQLNVGDPFDPEVTVGPVVNEVAFDRIRSAIDDGRRGGAGRVVTGGTDDFASTLGPELRRGYFVQPTLFADVDPSSSLAQAEIFGPVLAISSFRDEAEAIDVANATPYGLGTFLQTRDVSRVHRMAPMLESGSVSVNGTSGLPPGAPFGGYKLSGFGREGGRAGLDEFLQTKNVYIAP
jgi:acyl-CoA reductase-like NAD-dependent aldehyde dehydrogenase